MPKELHCGKYNSSIFPRYNQDEAQVERSYEHWNTGNIYLLLLESCPYDIKLGVPSGTFTDTVF